MSTWLKWFCVVLLSWGDMNKYLFTLDKERHTKEMIPPKSTLVSQWVYWGYIHTYMSLSMEDSKTAILLQSSSQHTWQLLKAATLRLSVQLAGSSASWRVSFTQQMVAAYITLKKETVGLVSFRNFLRFVSCSRGFRCLLQFQGNRYTSGLYWWIIMCCLSLGARRTSIF